MSYQRANPFGEAVDVEFSSPLTGYWLAILRLVTGWWFFHSGVGKLLQFGLNYTFGWIYLRGMGDTVLGPLAMGLFVMLLEVLIAFIQAYIFAALTAVFIGLIRHH